MSHHPSAAADATARVGRGETDRAEAARRGGGVAAVQLVVLAVAGLGLWWVAPTGADRLVIAALVAVLALGVAGQVGAEPARSRLPAAAQGFAVGAVVALGLGLLATGALTNGWFLVALLGLPGVFPAVVPARWRPAVTTRWTELIDRDPGAR